MSLRGWTIAFLLLCPLSALAQDEVLKALPIKDTEDAFKKLGFDAKTLEAPEKDVGLFELQVNKITIRIYNFAGKELMFMSAFPKIPLEQVNFWNVQTRFTRASLQKGEKDEFVALENNFDLSPGFTASALKQVANNYLAELSSFQQFRAAYLKNDVILPTVTNEKLEDVFRSMKIDVKKSQDKQTAIFEYTLDKISYRIVSNGGKDLLASVHFPKIPLEKVNEYNFSRKYVRLVVYKANEQEYTALESTLDCEAGTSEGIIRNFIAGFESETKNFIRFASGK